MGKTFTHPQPDWFPLHELPFRVSWPRPELFRDDPNFDPFTVSSYSESEAAAARAAGIAAQFDLKNGFRFAGVSHERRAFLFQQKSASDRDYDDADNLAITIPILTDRDPLSNALFRSFGVDSRGYAILAIGDAIHQTLGMHSADFVLWGRPQSPRAAFIQIEAASTKFYRISDFIAGIMVCDGFETLFDVHLASTKLPETALASEAQAIEFAANALRNNPNMKKEELKNALGRRFMVISDRRMQRVWAKARLMAGLSEFAKAGRKPGKSNR